MRRKIQKLTVYPFSRQFFLLYLIVVVLVTAVAFGALLGLLASYLKTSSSESASKLLNQLVSASEYIKEETDNLSAMVATNSDTLAFLSSTQEDKLTNYSLYLELNHYKANHPYVVDIAVVKTEPTVSVQTAGTNASLEADLELLGACSSGENGIFRRSVIFYDQTRSYEVVSFVYQLPSYGSAIIVDVDVSRFSFTVEHGGESQTVAVVDSQGGWVQHPEELPLSSLGQEELMELIESYGKGEDFFPCSGQGGQLLYFSRSDALGWWFIDSQSYPQFLQTYGTLGAALLGILLLVLGVYAALSLLFGRQMRKPLIRLVERLDPPDGATARGKRNEFQYLERFLAQMEHDRYLSDRHMDALYLSSVLAGREVPAYLRNQSLGEKYTAPYYGVLLIKLWPDYAISPEERSQEYSLLRYTIGNLGEEIFSADCRCCAADLREDCVAFVLLQQEEELPGLRGAFQQLKEITHKHFRLSLSASLGPVVDRFGLLHEACEKALHCLDLEGLMKKGAFLDTEHITAPTYQEKNRNLVDLIERYTQENYGNPDLSLKGISQKFHLSPAYLGKVFKTVKGVPYHSYLTTVRLERSKQALLDTNKKVVEIAAMVGFSNATYFTTVFKSTYGMTPSAYRGNVKPQDSDQEQ